MVDNFCLSFSLGMICWTELKLCTCCRQNPSEQSVKAPATGHGSRSVVLILAFRNSRTFFFFFIFYCCLFADIQAQEWRSQQTRPWPRQIHPMLQLWQMLPQGFFLFYYYHYFAFFLPPSDLCEAFQFSTTNLLCSLCETGQGHQEVSCEEHCWTGCSQRCAGSLCLWT